MKADILTSVFLRLRPSLKASAHGLLGPDDADVLDALQDAFCRLWRNRDAIRTPDHARAASFVAVRSAAIDMARRRHPSVDAAELLADTAASAPDRPDSPSELYEKVDAIIRRELSPREREVLLLRDRHGFEMDAIAARLDISEANVRLILSRARKKVRLSYRNSVNKKSTSTL